MQYVCMHMYVWICMYVCMYENVYMRMLYICLRLYVCLCMYLQTLAMSIAPLLVERL